jgi:cell division protein FtsB
MKIYFGGSGLMTTLGVAIGYGRLKDENKRLKEEIEKLKKEITQLKIERDFYKEMCMNKKG